MKYFKLISLIVIVLFLNACDKQSCRDCDTFNFELDKWSIMDDTISSNLTFLDQESNEYTFKIINSELSEPHEECELTNSVESVSCKLTKKIKYSCEVLNLDLILSYLQLEVIGGNPAVNDCFFNIWVKKKEDNNYFQTQFIDILHIENTKSNILISSDSISYADQKYKNVHQWNFNIMKDPSTNTEIEPRYIKSVTFQEPNGIVELILENDVRLILQN